MSLFVLAEAITVASTSVPVSKRSPRSSSCWVTAPNSRRMEHADRPHANLSRTGLLTDETTVGRTEGARLAKLPAVSEASPARSKARRLNGVALSDSRPDYPFRFLAQASARVLSLPCSSGLSPKAPADDVERDPSQGWRAPEKAMKQPKDSYRIATGRLASPNESARRLEGMVTRILDIAIAFAAPTLLTLNSFCFPVRDAAVTLAADGWRLHPLTSRQQVRKP